MKKITFLGLISLLLAIVNLQAQNAWINELHYDNDGTDVGEAVEVVIENAGSYNLSDFTVTFYNGNGGAVYGSITVDNQTITNSYGDFSVYYIPYPGIQNGAPDGLCLDYLGTLIPGQFLSYEGTFTAVGGPANGLTSVDMGVSEIGTTPIGQSLQLSGSGTMYDDFTWQAPATETPGAINNGQTFGGGGNSLPIIANIVQTPDADITSSTSVAVSADVTDIDGTITNAELHWGTTSGSLTNTINMSNTGGDTYTTDSDIPAQSNGTTVYYEIAATDDEPETSVTVEFNYTVFDPATTTLPYYETFDLDLGDCYTYSVSGPTKFWIYDSYGANGFAYMSGFNSGDLEEDWLVFPGINLDNYSYELMNFETWYNYGTDDENNYLKLFYSTDYSGIGDPTSATWTELTYNPPPSSQQWGSSGDIDLSGISGSMVYIAFKYNYEVGNYRNWEVDNVSIFESPFVDVTFQVNMEEQVVSPNGVHVAGSFNGWDPGATEMLDGDADDIYTVTLSLQAGIEYQFKYINGNAWGTPGEAQELVPAACGVDDGSGGYNRFVTVFGNTVLDVVCYGSCADCGALLDYDITFKVDMQNETVSGDGVFIAGTFTGWANAAMTNTSADIWEATFTLTETDYHEFKFKNGPDGWEGFDGGCVVWNGGNRYYTVPSENATYGPVCFNSCDPCPLPEIVINEADADTPGTDTQEFIELYDGGVGNTNLTGLVVVLYNGSNDLSYLAFDLDGYSTDASGYFVLGNAAVPNVDYVFPDNTLQNGADAIALYLGDGADFPNGTPVTTANLIDALVYDTNDPDDSGLLVLLNTDQPQINEGGRGNSADHSSQRIPNGSGGARNTDTYDQSAPTPGVENVSIFTDWTGVVDEIWNNAGNWTNGIPTSLINATIPDVGGKAPFPVIYGTAITADLYIAFNAQLTIAPGGDLTTAGLFDNDGAFYMSSNSSGISASFMDLGGLTGGGTFQFDRDLFCSGSNPLNPEDPFGWHYLGAPIDGLSTDDLLDYYVNQWNETTGNWMNYAGTPPCIPYSPAETLDGLEAWSINYDSEWISSGCPGGTGSTIEFMGSFASLHTGGYSAPATITSGDYAGWNMYGNPYASSIAPSTFNWTDFDNGTYGVAIYDGCAGNYIYSSLGNGFEYNVGPTQAFFLLANTPTSFALTGLERMHDNTQVIFKNEVTNLVTLEATGNGTSDLAYIRFMEGSSAAKDVADFPKLFSTTEGLAQIYTTAGAEMLAVNALPETPMVPLGFTSVTSGEYTISAIETSDFAHVVLEDLFTGEQINLLTNSYTFNYTTNDDPNRFIVHFTPLTTPEVLEEGVEIWTYDQHIYVQAPDIFGDIAVYNMMGQEVVRTNMEPGLNIIPVNDNNVLYIVKLVSSEVIKTGKVYIK